MQRRRWAKSIGSALLYALYLVSFLLAVHYAFLWRPFVKRMRDVQRPATRAPETTRYVNADVARQLGSLLHDKHSSFIHFEPAKAAGTVRVCALGDSFTYGSEVDETHDYPSSLQRLFDERGGARVEVINFGGPWHGFHQTYMLWDSVARHFSCDYVLLGPGNFYREREVTFNHTDLGHPYFLHARYVLDGDDVRFVPVLGVTHQERFDEYFRFFPRWTYLRYDRNAPPVLRAALPREQTIRNPFYYFRGTIQQEAFATYRILFRKLAASGVQVVLLHSEEAVVDLGNQVGMPNFVAAQTHRLGRFPYRASFDHYNAYGYQSIAEQFYARIAGERDTKLTVLETEDVPFNQSVASGRDAPSLASYDEVEVRLDDPPVGFFITPLWERGAGTSSSLKGQGIVALLALKTPETKLVDACFVPLDFGLHANADVVLKAGMLWNAVGHPLGNVRLIGDGLNIGVVDIEGIDCKAQRRLFFRGNRTVSRQAAEAGTFTIMVGAHAVLKGFMGAEGVELLPAKGALRRIRAGLATSGDVDDLKSSGDINLVLHHRQYGTTSVRIGRWKKGVEEMPRAERVLEKPLSIADGSQPAGQ